MRHRLRSALTMLGIVWGLVSVVILLAYGQGLGGSVLHAFLNMGDNVIVICPGQTSMQAGGERAGKKVKFEYEDVQAIREEVPIVRAVSGEVNRNLAFKYATRVVSLKVRGVDLPYGHDAQARHRRRPLFQRPRFRGAQPGSNPRPYRGQKSFPGCALHRSIGEHRRAGFRSDRSSCGTRSRIPPTTVRTITTASFPSTRIGTSRTSAIRT